MLSRVGSRTLCSAAGTGGMVPLGSQYSRRRRFAIRKDEVVMRVIHENPEKNRPDMWEALQKMELIQRADVEPITDIREFYRVIKKLRKKGRVYPIVNPNLSKELYHRVWRVGIRPNMAHKVVRKNCPYKRYARELAAEKAALEKSANPPQ